MPEISGQKSRFLLIGIFFFFLFCLFSFLVKEDLLVQFDFDTTVRLQNNIPGSLDTLFSYFSVLGSFEVTTLALLVLLLVRRRVDGIFILFGFGVFMAMELFGKIVVDHPGPPYLFARYKSLVEFPTSYIPHPAGAYPSGHSGRTIFLSIIVLFMLFSGKKALSAVKYISAGVIIGFSFIMLLSRIVLGEHWTTDVIGGVLLATSLAFLTLPFLKVPKKSLPRTKTV